MRRYIELVKNVSRVVEKKERDENNTTSPFDYTARSIDHNPLTIATVGTTQISVPLQDTSSLDVRTLTSTEFENVSNHVTPLLQERYTPEGVTLFHKALTIASDPAIQNAFFSNPEFIDLINTDINSEETQQRFSNLIAAPHVPLLEGQATDITTTVANTSAAQCDQWVESRVKFCDHCGASMAKPTTPVSPPISYGHVGSAPPKAKMAPGMLMGLVGAALMGVLLFRFGGLSAYMRSLSKGVDFFWYSKQLILGACDMFLTPWKR